MFKMVGFKFCPECESQDVYDVDGGVSGIWTCKECGYSGMLPEKENRKNEIEKSGKSGGVKNVKRRR